MAEVIDALAVPLNMLTPLVVRLEHTLEDVADRLYSYTFRIFAVFAVLLLTRIYVLTPIMCYVPVGPADGFFQDYLNQYCWVHGTIPLRRGEMTPLTEEMWEALDRHRRITYYHLVPFVLATQCFAFTLPHVIWKAMSKYRSGADLFKLIQSACEASIMDLEARAGRVKAIAAFLRTLIHSRRYHTSHLISRRESLLPNDADGQVKPSTGKSKCTAWYEFDLLTGTYLLPAYISVKLFSMLVALGQLFLMQHFLGFHISPQGEQLTKELQKEPQDDTDNVHGIFFGIKVLSQISRGYGWPETTFFPRSSYCRVPGIRLVGTQNTYTAQCALPVNVLNECIYTFFWFWVVLLLTANVISLVYWLVLAFTPMRFAFIGRYLRTQRVTKFLVHRKGRQSLEAFTDTYLSRDGVFLMRMLALNAGELMTCDVVVELCDSWLHEMSQKLEPETEQVNERVML